MFSPKELWRMWIRGWKDGAHDNSPFCTSTNPQYRDAYDAGYIYARQMFFQAKDMAANLYGYKRTVLRSEEND